MPGMDGMALLSRLQEEWPDLSVVILTGHGNMEMAVQALRLGAADFLTKPVKLLELDGVLEKVGRLRALQKDRSALRETVGRLQTDQDAQHPRWGTHWRQYGNTRGSRTDPTGGGGSG